MLFGRLGRGLAHQIGQRQTGCPPRIGRRSFPAFRVCRTSGHSELRSQIARLDGAHQAKQAFLLWSARCARGRNNLKCLGFRIFGWQHGADVQAAQVDESAPAQQWRGFQRFLSGTPLVHGLQRNAHLAHLFKASVSQTRRGLQRIGTGVVVEHPKNRKIVRYRAARRLPRGMGRGARVPDSICGSWRSWCSSLLWRCSARCWSGARPGPASRDHA